MKVKNQMDKKFIEIISKFKGNQVRKLCNHYILKNYRDGKDSEFVKKLHYYYLGNEQPKHLSDYERLYNAYNACYGFYGGVLEYNKEQVVNSAVEYIRMILNNSSDLLHNCKKDLKILNMLLSKNNDDLDDVLEEVYNSSASRWLSLWDYKYIFKHIYNTGDVNESFEYFNKNTTILKEFLGLFLECHNCKDYKSYFEHFLNDVENYEKQFSKLEENEKIKNIINEND